MGYNQFQNGDRSNYVNPNFNNGRYNNNPNRFVAQIATGQNQGWS